jgi:hypothetical protein
MDSLDPETSSYLQFPDVLKISQLQVIALIIFVFTEIIYLALDTGPALGLLFIAGIFNGVAIAFSIKRAAVHGFYWFTTIALGSAIDECIELGWKSTNFFDWPFVIFIGIATISLLIHLLIHYILEEDAAKSKKKGDPLGIRKINNANDSRPRKIN